MSREKPRPGACRGFMLSKRKPVGSSGYWYIWCPDCGWTEWFDTKVEANKAGNRHLASPVSS